MAFTDLQHWKMLVLSMTIMNIALYYVASRSFLSFSFFYLICFFFKKRASKINDQLNIISKQKSEKILNDLKRAKRISQIIIDHNKLCRQVLDYNKFWQKYYVNTIFCVFPINLCLLQQVLFSDLHFMLRILYSFCVLASWIFIFYLNFIASSVSKHVQKSAKALYKIQLEVKRTNLWINNLKIKIKLMSTFECVSGMKIIGFSARSLFMITFPVFYNKVRNYVYLKLGILLNILIFDSLFCRSSSCIVNILFYLTN